MHKTRSIFIAKIAEALRTPGSRSNISSWYLSIIIVAIGHLALTTSLMASSLAAGPNTSGSCDPTVGKMYSKSEAILGGKISSLESIEAAQRGNIEPSCISAYLESSELPKQKL